VEMGEGQSGNSVDKGVGDVQKKKCEKSIK
jgi:hypothetical protein